MTLFIVTGFTVDSWTWAAINTSTAKLTALKKLPKDPGRGRQLWTDLVIACGARGSYESGWGRPWSVLYCTVLYCTVYSRATKTRAQQAMRQTRVRVERKSRHSATVRPRSSDIAWEQGTCTLAAVALYSAAARLGRQIVHVKFLSGFPRFQFYMNSKSDIGAT